MFRTERNLRIGEWAVIENFKVSSVGKGKFRPTNNQYKMTITGDSVYSKSDHQDDSIFLTLADYENILKGLQDVNILIGICFYVFLYYKLHLIDVSTNENAFSILDIIGQQYDISDVQIIQVKGEDRKRVQFRMRDLR